MAITLVFRTLYKVKFSVILFFKTGGYVVEEVLLPFLLKSCSETSPLEHQPGVEKVLDLMWVCMEVS